MAFLSGIQLRPLATGGIPGCETLGLALGQGQSPLEVVVLRSAAQPPVIAMRTAWKDRHGGRPAPVLLVAVYGNRAAVCGPSGDNPPVLTNVELGQAERLCITALEEPDRHSALRFLRPALAAIDSPMAGLRNEGLLSTHEIGVWLKERSDLAETVAKSQKAIIKRGKQLGDIRDERRRLRPDQPHQQFGLGRGADLDARITPQGHVSVAVSAFAAVRLRLTARKRVPLSGGLAHSRVWTE
jgi:hypothetical protein